MKEYLKHFIEGWEKDSKIEKPKTFLKYFIHYPINWIWTLGSILFIGLFLTGEHKYEAPIFYFLALIPFLMLAYNVITEYNAFKNNGISGKLMAFIFYGACVLDLLILMAILFFSRIN